MSKFKIHAGLGVVAAIVEAPDGELRLSFDDVRTDTPSDPKEWPREVHYTNRGRPALAIDCALAGPEQAAWPSAELNR